ncbi:alpha/beta hydrolase [Paractinoplanes abujensis]|uniref:Pimeloyl-ACP methyl ester carboxylesterase n=1 Tax=Paractinoplanes abujensis TaxID=882441 RepID=A0A7W7CRC7_9ACTN|nr:alpha/beta hydrolase [Actinoplanes abujensis]MBB4693282.1 pimeloyl-ACP methyl ester carboxylesterase [Actinoplanes abujensis]GID24482.1 alpha/beta hydrolase [Actinoplanes abujensis]
MRRTLSFFLVAMVAIGTAAGVRGVSDAATSKSLSWGPCPADVGVPTLECGTVEVPLDYRQPRGRTIEIAVSRLPSKKPAERRGVLLTNPGGPGGAGLSYPGLIANPIFPQPLPQSVQDHYDVIGFDPRGVGHSAPVTCDYRLDQMARQIVPYPENPAEVVEEATFAKTVARQCATSATAGLLPHITTANTARDMDRIRDALGEPKISYLGSSYGTYLGAVYTTLFPNRSDRIVLDSNTGPGGYDYTTFRRLALGMEQRFPDFARFAAANPRYGLGTSAAQVRKKYFQLAARLEKKPVQGIDGSVFREHTFNLLYNDASFPVLAQDWQALDTGRPVSYRPPATADDNKFSSHMHVLCGDSQWPRNLRTYQREVARQRIKYPLLGAAAANIGPCAFWPSPVERPVRIGDDGPSNVLLVQNLRDPGTPLVGALELRKAFGHRARLITADQGGHGAYVLFAQNKCANNAVTAFLTTGQRPPHDLSCAAESS